MFRTVIFVCAACVAFNVSIVVAGGSFGDWDGPGHLPGPGPYTGDGDVTVGDPTCVQVGVAGNEAPAPPFGGNGNILCIDTRNKPSKIIVGWTFSCDDVTNGVCQVNYDFSGYANSAGGGFNVHVNSGGQYDNPDDMWAPIGPPPTTTSGDNSELESNCATLHTIEFEVLPGTLVYIDNVSLECLLPISVEESPWSAIKQLYRD